MLVPAMMLMSACGPRDPVVHAQSPEPPMTAEEPEQPPLAVAASMQPTHVLVSDSPVPVDASTTLTVDGVIVETLEPSPDGAYPGGGAIEISLRLQRGGYESRTSLLDITEGYEPRRVAWLDDLRIELVEVKDLHHAPKVHVVLETVGTTTTDAPAQRIRIERGQTVTLADGHRLEFVGHGHKRTFENQASPLIVHTRWNLPGFEPVDDGENLQTSEGERTWRFRDVQLTLIDWDYDGWMELEIRALRRVPITAP